MVDYTYSIEELKGMTFGSLKVIAELEPKMYHYRNRDAKVRMMKCRCKCGNITTVSLNNLLRGHTTSCGCYKREYCKTFLKNYRCLSNEAQIS